MRHIKDRTERLDKYFPCGKNDYKLRYIQKLQDLFLDCHDADANNSQVNRSEIPINMHIL